MRGAGRGFSMIEVLITLLLICIGMLGVVALQGRAISYTQDSVRRNIAAALADDLMEMIRAQRDQVLSATGQPRSSSDFYKAAGSDFPDAASDCSTTPTSTSEKLGCWAAKAGASLPGASDLLKNEFYVCRSAVAGTCNSSAGSAIEIRIAWAVKSGECLDKDADANSTTCFYTLRSEI